MPRLLIAASGTGGHLFPALAVAESLPSHWKVSWLGVPDRLETQLIPSEYQLFLVRAGGLQAHGFKRLLQLLQLLFSTPRVRSLLIDLDIDAVFTTGGYIAAPAILAAIWCGLPVVLHESNACPGKVTRLLGRFCKIVAIGFPSTATSLSGCNSVLTGTPVRPSFLIPQGLPSWVPCGPGPLIVVVGGSQGAVGLNRMVRPIVPSLLKAGCRVVHLTGENDSQLTQISHPNLVERIFSDEIASLLQHAALVISRAGAGAISELAVCGTPAILVPYPQSTDQHQDANALRAAELGAAVIVHQHAPAHRALRDAIWRILGNYLVGNDENFDVLLEMKKGMERLAILGSEEKLVDILNKII